MSAGNPPGTTDAPDPPPAGRPIQTWPRRFANAGRGVLRGIQGQPSFRVHLAIAVAVVGAGFWLQADLVRWCILVLCIGMVLTAELFNSSLEWLARSLTDRQDERIGRALDIASGAVLLAAVTAAAVGILVFGDLLWNPAV